MLCIQSDCVNKYEIIIAWIQKLKDSNTMDQIAENKI